MEVAERRAERGGQHVGSRGGPLAELREARAAALERVHQSALEPRLPRSAAKQERRQQQQQRSQQQQAQRKGACEQSQRTEC